MINTIPIPTATNIKAENAEGTQFSAEINGKRWPGIQEGSTDWKSVEKAIADGAVPEPYVPYEPTYKEKRAKEYPQVGDQLDAIWKQLNKDRLDGKDLISEADSLLGAVLAVKAKYPKDV